MALPPSLDGSSGADKKRRGILFGFLRAVLALAITVFIFQIKLDFIEAWFYDMRIRFRPSPAVTGEVVIVSVNPETVERLKGAPDYEAHARFLRKLAETNPRAIVYDIRFDELKGDNAGKAKLAEAAKLVPQLSVLTGELEMKGEEGKLRLPSPFENIHLHSGPLSSDEFTFGRDRVTRRFLVEYQGSRMLHVELAQKINPEIQDVNKIRGVFDRLGTLQSYIDFRPAGTYPIYPFAAVLDGLVSADVFKDKIVIVGRDTQVSDKDYVLTPYSREVVGMTSAEAHANIIDTLIRNSAPARAPGWLDFIVIAVICWITVQVVFKLKPTRGLVTVGATIAAFLIIGALAFWPFGLWISMAHPLLAVFLCYYFFIPYRLIIENRRSWEIFQKHQLLQQVEELKTNFISMMSHDLKTPIARILGMTDIISNDKSPLSTQQREALDTIRHSSDDLLKFINAILQYGKIESQNIQLHFQNKDPNALLSEVIRKHEFLAKLKRIQIRSELEPLFPVPVDPELIKQVFSNLIENAIKYSPEDTSILVSSEEENGRIFIQVADQGQGIPADELPNIFMKFFRSKNAKSSPIKGSGLGLYLAKYFTELHRGKLTVESTYGQGSTFTVELPLEQGRNHA